NTNLTVNATVTDPAGNSSDATATNPVDAIAPTVDVTHENGSGPNGAYNDDDSKDGAVEGIVTFGPETEDGDTVTINDKDNKILLERPLTQDDLDNGITVEVPVKPDDTEVKLNAKVTDPAGNSSDATDTKDVDNVTPTVEVELEPGTGTNGKYNAEDTKGGTVEGEITFGPETQPGDKITATDKDGSPIVDKDGNPLTDYELTPED